MICACVFVERDAERKVIESQLDLDQEEFVLGAPTKAAIKNNKTQQNKHQDSPSKSQTPSTRNTATKAAVRPYFGHPPKDDLFTFGPGGHNTNDIIAKSANQVNPEMLEEAGWVDQAWNEHHVTTSKTEPRMPYNTKPAPNQWIVPHQSSNSMDKNTSPAKPGPIHPHHVAAIKQQSSGDATNPSLHSIGAALITPLPAHIRDSNAPVFVAHPESEPMVMINVALRYGINDIPRMYLKAGTGRLQPVLLLYRLNKETLKLEFVDKTEHLG